MTWAQRLKRVFNIDIETCHECGSTMKVIACIEDLVVIKKMFDHLWKKAETNEPTPLPGSRGPPIDMQMGLFDCQPNKPTTQLKLLRQVAAVGIRHA